jgi:acetyl esterase/lipase
VRRRRCAAGGLRVSQGPVGPVLAPALAGGPVILYLDDGCAGWWPAPGGLAARLAAAAGATVVCCRWDAEFPAALRDASAGYRYCRAMGPVAVAGERLGAGLAASLLVWLRDTGAAMPRCATLVSAALDLTLQAPSMLLNAAADVTLDAGHLRERAERYAAGRPPSDPLLSPALANLHGLPPVQLLAAGTDLLLDDSVAFAARAAHSGVAVDLQVRPDSGSLRAQAAAAMADFIGTWSAAAAQGNQ